MDRADAPIGLALGYIAGSGAHLLSLTVAAPARRAGHGRRLLDCFVAAVHDAGAQRIEVIAPLSSENTPIGLLTGGGGRDWTRAGLATVTIKAEPERVAAALAARRIRTVPHWTLMPWSYRPDPWWAPSDLAPSKFIPLATDGRPCCASATVEIRHGGALAGWIVAHDMGQGWLRVSSSFLKQGGGARRAVFDLWRRYFAMVAEQGWATVTFATTEDHGPFFAFLNRWAPEFAQWWGCSAPFSLTMPKSAHAG
ncbi:GNAT family N-acetyltransferase [Sphingomonas qomolangmaensis]|uniref:GNAT family N-acetyltransferase n=1 Tax=Sphingomonas qomolangmaensis TaxID=2918765 RepID=A0ABY5LDQ8_9SPHN|nr:GNAT family N-acetyltransferase [Sphingomonas qomolangmaensis]UUL84026.1 GNAT family N-acetyltransferase [Sphingomonas qomolangmaensis]